jgi:hypothetical protein
MKGKRAGRESKKIRKRKGEVGRWRKIIERGRERQKEMN